MCYCDVYLFLFYFVEFLSLSDCLRASTDFNDFYFFCFICICWFVMFFFSFVSSILRVVCNLHCNSTHAPIEHYGFLWLLLLQRMCDLHCMCICSCEAHRPMQHCVWCFCWGGVEAHALEIHNNIESHTTNYWVGCRSRPLSSGSMFLFFT